jgi:hypothetical protein
VLPSSIQIRCTVGQTNHGLIGSKAASSDSARPCSDRRCGLATRSLPCVLLEMCTARFDQVKSTDVTIALIDALVTSRHVEQVSSRRRRSA